MSKEVQSMFANISGRYDLANDILSLGVHRLWRKKALAFAGVESKLVESELKVLDVCTGTGDLGYEVAKRLAPSATIYGLDFVGTMLEEANRKYGAKNNFHFLCGDAMQLPFSNDLFDLVTVAFGIRNVDSALDGLKELNRVLKPNGKLLVLEFGRVTTPGLATVFDLYSSWMMPRLGQLVTGNRAAYEYLPKTSRAFPCGKAFMSLMDEAGFNSSHFCKLWGGIAYVYTGQSTSKFSSARPSGRSTFQQLGSSSV